MDHQTAKEADKNKSVSINELLEISKWVVKIVLSINRKWAITSLLLNVVSHLQPLIYTFLFARILDYIIKLASSNQPDIRSIYPVILILVLYNIIFSILNFLENIYAASIDIKSELSLQQIYYEKIHSLGIQTLESPEINNQIYRTSGIFGSVLTFYDKVSSLLSTVINTLVTFYVCMGISPSLVLLIILVSCPRYFADKKYRKLFWQFTLNNTENTRKATVSAGDLKNPGYLQEIFINNSFSFFDKKFKDFMAWSVNVRINIRREAWAKYYLYQFLGDLALYWGYIIIIKNFFNKLISVGDIYFQINILGSLQRNINNTLGTINVMFESSVRIKDIYELFKLNPAFDDGSIQLRKLEVGPVVKIENLGFIYPGSERNILKNINFEIKSGEKVAIVGQNGAGKTTLVRLFCKMYQPTLGKILINGLELNTINSRSLHDNMGVLFQDFNTYTHLTPKENIYLGRPDETINEQRIIEAAKNADAIKFIEELPKGFDNILSEKYKGGVKLSTGQWQKLAIARFFYRNSPFVIFDEPTASIDAESEYNIFNKIYSFFKDKTVIIISHRFSTVRNADRILVLKDGEFVEQGTHIQLLNMDGEYARAFKLQAEGYNIEKLETIA